MPERVEHELPMCPWCGETYEGSGNQYTRVPCVCGKSFEAEMKVVFVSRALQI